MLQVSPKGDLVLCKVAEAEEQTTGGLLLPSSAQSKPTSGICLCCPFWQLVCCKHNSLQPCKAVCKFTFTRSFVHASGDIVALGDGQVGGNVQKFDLQVGQTVVYSKFGIGSTDLDIQGQRHTMLREDDCIGIMPKSNATASDIPELKPVGDRVLIKASSLQCYVVGNGLFCCYEMQLHRALAYHHKQQCFQAPHHAVHEKQIRIGFTVVMLCIIGARTNSCNSRGSHAARERARETYEWRCCQCWAWQEG